jgi:hypothetical protein
MATASATKAREYSQGPPPAAEDLELPGPLRLLRMPGLAESSGLPVAAYMVAAWLDGREAALVAGLALIWLTAVIRKVATGSVPGLLTISALVLTVLTWLVLATGELWLFPLQLPLASLCMCALFGRTAGGPDPLVARLAAELVTLRQRATRHPGLHRFVQGGTWLWASIFLLLPVALEVLKASEPTGLFLLLTTIATAPLVVASTAASTQWFLSALRRLGLRLRFAPA